MAKCTRASVDEVLTRFQVGDKRFIEALGLRDGFVSVQGEVLVEMAEVIAAANAEIERLKSDRQQVSDAVRVACELLTFDNGGNFGAAMLLLSEVIGEQPHAQ